MSQNRYSPSRLKLFESCPFQYKCKYIDLIEGTQKESSDTNFGSLIHKMAEIYNGNNKQELIPLVKEYKLDKEYKSYVLPTINNFFEFFERYKQYEYKTEKEYELKTNDYWLYGIIDRIMERSNDLVIVDYKTAKNADRKRHEFQMKFYNLMIWKLLDLEPKKIKTLIYFPRPNVEEKFMFSNQEIMDFEESIKIKIAKIEENKEWTACEGYHCKWCFYKSSHCLKFKTE